MTAAAASAVTTPAALETLLQNHSSSNGRGKRSIQTLQALPSSTSTAILSPAIPQTQRVAYLTSVYIALRETFNFTTLPPSVLVTCGWPSRQARGRAASRRPAEFLPGQWIKNDREAAFLSVHPERLRSPETAALSILYEMAHFVGGKRATNALGILHNRTTGEIELFAGTNPDFATRTSINIAAIVLNAGELPAGFAEIPEPRVTPKQKGRLRKWVCSVAGCDMPPVRIASDTLGHQMAHTIHRPHAPLKPAPVAAKTAKATSAKSVKAPGRPVAVTQMQKKHRKVA